jgi:hypothetical protein
MRILLAAASGHKMVRLGAIKDALKARPEFKFAS